MLKTFMAETRPLLTKQNGGQVQARDFEEMSVGSLSHLMQSSISLHKACIANQSKFFSQ